MPRDIQVETSLGRLLGIEDGEVAVFRGIPYATPPVGSLRFAPPRDREPWLGVREARAFADMAPQPSDPGFYPGDPEAMPLLPMSEDCLYLNVWTPRRPGPHPVLVWVHGGAQVVGGTARPVYDGSAFARAGIVCVTVGYRLGAFGFLECGPLFPARAGSGNNALLDIMAALRWVADGIAAFGGDPGRVTVGGESAGAKNIAALIAAPSARGLFRSAIMQSGGGESVRNPAQAEVLARSWAELTGLTGSALLEGPWTAVLAAQQQVIGAGLCRFPFCPVVDGRLLPKRPLDAVRAGAGAEVSLLIGTARDECMPQVPDAVPLAPWTEAMLAHMAPADMAEVEAVAAAVLPHLSPVERRRLLLTAEEYTLPSIRFAEAHARNGRPTWMYRFDTPYSDGPLKGYATHVADLGLVWHQPERLAQLPEGAAARRMHWMWCDFIATGHADWPPFDGERQATALIADELTVAYDTAQFTKGLFGGGKLPI